MVVDYECIVPNIAMSTIEVIPTYENPTNNLTKLTTGFNAIVSVYLKIDIYAILSNGIIMMQSTDDVNSPILSYTINYMDTNTGKSCGTGTIPATVHIMRQWRM